MSADSAASGFECWGIYRELAHSPGRETDDAEILRATARRLEGKGFRVSLRTAEEIAATAEDPPPFLFVMCERLEILRRLESWAERGDVHATGQEDVVFAPDQRTAARELKEIAARGIAKALLQAHVPGDL